MSASIITKAATLLCAHGGRGAPGRTSTRVRAGGQPVVLLPVPWVISGCAYPPVAGPPDTAATFLVGSRRVRVEGSPVHLADTPGTALATGTPPLVVDPGQARVRAT